VHSTASPTQIYHPHLPEVQPGLTDEALRTVSPILEERPEYHNVVWRQKGSNPTNRL